MDFLSVCQFKQFAEGTWKKVLNSQADDVIGKKIIGYYNRSPHHFTLWPSHQLMPNHCLCKCSIMCSSVILCSLQVNSWEMEMRRGKDVHGDANLRCLRRGKWWCQSFFLSFFNCQESVFVYPLPYIPLPHVLCAVCLWERNDRFTRCPSWTAVPLTFNLQISSQV